MREEVLSVLVSVCFLPQKNLIFKQHIRKFIIKLNKIMNGQKLKKLCEKHNVKLGDLPAFPTPKMAEIDDKKWEEFIKTISESKINLT